MKERQHRTVVLQLLLATIKTEKIAAQMAEKVSTKH